MSQEIELKFLVKELPNLEGKPYLDIEQGYLCLGDKEEVRLRSTSLPGHEHIYTLTVKKGSGLVRGEEEIRIEKQQFDQLWPMTRGRRLTKKRYDYWRENDDIEIDIYKGPLKGLLVAEVEFESVEEAKSFEPPFWLGQDITNDERYKNRSLATCQCIPESNKHLSLEQQYMMDKLADMPAWRKDV